MRDEKIDLVMSIDDPELQKEIEAKSDNLCLAISEFISSSLDRKPISILIVHKALIKILESFEKAVALEFMERSNPEDIKVVECDCENCVRARGMN
jgi:hypothetical protein